MTGQLCVPEGATATAVQVLIPGASYNKSYWDFPYDPANYSYQRYMAAQGLSTFAIDLLDTGLSSRSVSPFLMTVNTEAEAVHQVVQAVRSGQVDGTHHARVLLVGHSLGSFVAVVEGATYHDVDGLLLSGFTSYASVPIAVGLATLQAMVPAQWAGSSPNVQHQPLGELSTPPGARARYFYNGADADPRVIAEDEATKDVVPVGLLGSIVPEEGLSALVDVPVMVADGQDDGALQCGLAACSSAAQLRRMEAPLFPGAPSLSTYVLPDAGHDVNLHLNASSFFAVAASWLRSQTG